MITISHSKRTAYDCPYYFYMRYIKREPMKKDIFLSEGTFLHQVAQVYTNALIKHKLTADNDLLEDTFRQLWKIQDEIPESLHDENFTAVKKFGERFSVNPQTIWKTELGIAFTELIQPVEFPPLESYEAEDEWAEENGVWVHQRLDRVDIDPSGRQATVTDYKTARAVTSRSELERRGQGKQYAWALLQYNPSLEKVNVVFDFIRFDHGQVTLEYDRENTVHVPHILQTFSEKINHKDPNDLKQWPALQGIPCTICNYPCPLNDESVGVIKVIQDYDTAVKIAQKKIALEREAEQFKKILSDYTKSRADVDVGIGRFTQVTALQFTRNADTLVDFCLRHGLTFNKFLSVNKDKLEKQKAFLDEEATAELFQIEQAFPSKLVTKFRFIENPKVKEAKAEKEGEQPTEEGEE